jgi:chemotaxis protein MotB
MKRSPQRHAHASTDRWMVSYMDVLTILLIFFVAAAAQSAMPHPVPEKPPEVHVAPPPPPPPPPPAHAELLKPEQKLALLGLDLKMDPRGLVISLPQTILFASGTDVVSAEARATVEQIAGILREIPNKVTLVGHADAVPIHNRRFRNNWELAAARSLRLLEMLGRDGGIEESRLSVASYSSFDPKDTNETPDGRASNRRVEIVILDEHSR